MSVVSGWSAGVRGWQMSGTVVKLSLERARASRCRNRNPIALTRWSVGRSVGRTGGRARGWRVPGRCSETPRLADRCAYIALSRDRCRRSTILIRGAATGRARAPGRALADLLAGHTDGRRADGAPPHGDAQAFTLPPSPPDVCPRTLAP